MSEHDEPTLDDVIIPEERAIPDHHQHGKGYGRPNDDELEHRTEQERVEAGVEDYDPDEIPSATE
jgi:hypothetical protein